MYMKKNHTPLTNAPKVSTLEAFSLVPNPALEMILETQEKILEALNLTHPFSKSGKTPKAIGEFIPEDDAMELFGRKRTWFWNKRNSGELKFTKVGGRVYYAKSDIINLLESNKKGGY